MIKINSCPQELPEQNSPLLTEGEAAAFLKVSPAKLRRLRYDKRGPKTVKIGGSHRIRRSALVQWLAEQED